VTVYLVNYMGTLGGGVETFQHSIVLDRAGAFSGIEEDILDQAEAGLTALHGGTFKSNWPSATVWTNIRCAEVLDLTPNAGQPQLKQAVNRAVSEAGSSSATAPLQLSCVISLQGGEKPNGTPYRGRFHLPAPAFGSSTPHGTMNTTLQGVVLDQAEAMLNALFNPLESMAPQIWSRVAGETLTVEKIRVGRQLDTVRSRRRDAPENYSDADVG